MIYPTIILDNFFNDPYKIVEYSKSLEYSEDKEGNWPGKRSEPLHKIDRVFFESFGCKILSIFYPMVKDKFSFNCELFFQKMSKEYNNEGWVHSDFNTDFTSIIYLSNHKKCGTSFFDSKKICPNFQFLDKKREMYIQKKFKDNEIYVKNNNDMFTETINVKSKFNRGIIFDGAQYHGSQKIVEEGVEEDRLTLIGFFWNINFPGIKFNGVEHKRIV